MRKIIILGLFSTILLASCKKETTNPDSNPQNTTSENKDFEVITFNPTIKYGTVTDIDGNTYKTVQIAGKEWMAENLKVKRYSNGEPIQIVDWTSYGKSFIDWIYSGVDSWKYFSSDSLEASKKFKVYGLQYNWKVVSDSRNVCPTGWHVPSEAEFTSLLNSQGGMYQAGKKLIETGTAHWKDDQGTNESGFTALPSGPLTLYGTINDEVLYWTKTSHYFLDSNDETDSSLAKVFSISDVSKVEIYQLSKDFGSVIRCVKN